MAAYLRMNNHQTSSNQNLLHLKSLKIASINVNSIITNQRRASLLEFINENNPDIALICKTKLNQQHILRFIDYNVIRTDRQDSIHSGGTAILIKQHFKYKQIFINTLIKPKVIETTIIKLKLDNDNNLFIISLYAKSGHYKEFKTELEEIFIKLELNKPTNYYIIAGDYNAKHVNWKNSNNNPYGIHLNR